MVDEYATRNAARESLVPKGGLEPPRVAPHAPQTCASANSATSAPASRKYAGGLIPCQSDQDGRLPGRGRPPRCLANRLLQLGGRAAHLIGDSRGVQRGAHGARG